MILKGTSVRTKNVDEMYSSDVSNRKHIKSLVRLLCLFAPLLSEDMEQNKSPKRYRESNNI